MEGRDRTTALVGESWSEILHKELEKPYIRKLGTKVAALRKISTIYPAKEQVFRAFKLTPYVQTTVVIVGQDPYHNGQADGLAFSSSKLPIPASLKNIFTEIEEDLQILIENSPDLSRWASQGVLLLNRHLTVTKGQPASHSQLGWDTLTGKIIRFISLNPVPTVFMLWGNQAKEIEHLIEPQNHLILKAAHPSPRVTAGFLGCKHFSQCNNFLSKHNLQPINWK